MMDEWELDRLENDWYRMQSYNQDCADEDDEWDYEYCALCGDKTRPKEMSKEIDGYCLQCVAEVIGSVNALALKELTAEEYDLYRKIFSPLEEVE